MRIVCFLMTVSLVALLSGCASQAFVQESISANNSTFVQQSMKTHQDELLKTLTPAVDRLVKQQAKQEKTISGLRVEMSKKDDATKKTVADLQARLSELNDLHASDMESMQAKFTTFRQAFVSQTKALDESIETFRTEMNKQAKKTDEIITGLERFLRSSVTELKSVSDEQGKTLEGLLKISEKLVSEAEQQERLVENFRKASDVRHTLLVQVFSGQVEELQDALSSLEKTSASTATPEDVTFDLK